MLARMLASMSVFRGSWQLARSVLPEGEYEYVAHTRQHTRPQRGSLQLARSVLPEGEYAGEYQHACR
jgi:hypothetical protein